jgi:hypothetical protein
VDTATKAENEVLAVVDALALREAFPELDAQALLGIRGSLPTDWRYREFFFALKFSPSYDLASRISTGELRRTDQSLPADFAAVEATQRRFGDVRRVEFAPWWVRTASKHFATASAARHIALVRVAQHGRVTAQELGQLQRGLQEQPTDAGPALIISLPLRGHREEVLAEIGRLLDMEQEAWDDAFRFQDNAVRQHTVVQARRLLCARVVAPGHPLYVIGNRAGVSPINEHDESKPRHEVLDQRRTVEILTSRHLRRAYNIAEQAARGRFPCLDALEGDRALRKREQRDRRFDFDYPSLLGRVTDYFTWMSDHFAGQALAGQGEQAAHQGAQDGGNLQRR